MFEKKFTDLFLMQWFKMAFVSLECHLCFLKSKNVHAFSIQQSKMQNMDYKLKFSDPFIRKYRKTSNISRTLVGNKIVDNSDVVGASPVGAAPTASSFST